MISTGRRDRCHVAAATARCHGPLLPSTSMRMLTFALCLVSASAHAAISDHAVHVPVAYGVQAPPRSATNADPVFGARVRRLTDARADGRTWDQHEYSVMSPFNSDESLVLLAQGGSSYATYDLYGGLVRAFPDVVFSAEPRWSKSDPDTIYYHQGNELRRLRVDTGASTLVHRFDAYGAIGFGRKQELSDDGDHLVLVGFDASGNNPVAILTWTFSTAAIGGPLVMSAPYNHAAITPDNHVIVEWSNVGAGRFMGLELYDLQMNFRRQVVTWAAHADVCRDPSGDEVLIATNSADPQPLGNLHQIVKVRLADSVETALVPLAWRFAVHISCRSHDGWAVVSTYSPSNPDPSVSWLPFENEILRVRTDGSGEVERLAHHQSRPLDDYNYMPKASASPSGRYIVYDSNYNQQPSYDYTDVYLIDRVTPPHLVGRGHPLIPRDFAAILGVHPMPTPSIVRPASCSMRLHRTGDRSILVDAKSSAQILAIDFGDGRRVLDGRGWLRHRYASWRRGRHVFVRLLARGADGRTCHQTVRFQVR